MLFAEINAEVKKYQDSFFTGHLKFGIEKSVIVSLTENSRLELSEIKKSADYVNQLAKLCTNPDYYGSIEFDLILGKVERLNYCISYNGMVLKRKLGINNAEM